MAPQLKMTPLETLNAFCKLHDLRRFLKQRKEIMTVLKDYDVNRECYSRHILKTFFIWLIKYKDKKKEEEEEEEYTFRERMHYCLLLTEEAYMMYFENRNITFYVIV